jgi:hypothetical protein
MAEIGILPQELKDQLDAIGTADIVVGLPGLKTSDDLDWISEIAGLGQRLLIACPSSGELPVSEQVAGLDLLHYPVSQTDRFLNAPPPLFGSFQEVFQISQKVGAKCCCVWNTSLQPVSAHIISELVNPLLHEGFDLAVPRYIEMKLGSLINSSIIYPLVRALYGKGILYPMAIDLGFSAQFVDRLVKPDPKTHLPRSQQWIAMEAICNGLTICQVYLPMEPPRPPESIDVSSLLVTVLGRLFSDLERNATFWQRSNGSPNIPAFGEATTKETEESPVDVHPMIETFQLGYRNLREIWNFAMPPATSLELKKLAALPANAFRMPDDLWVRIVYDFALAYRQRAINREHLLRAMTPLYLAWVASYALETKDTSPDGFHYYLERLALAYEKQKPYLLSRWRWPDRFNP